MTVCASCGKPFDRPAGSQRRTCSRSCAVSLGWRNASPEVRAARCEANSVAQIRAGAGARLNTMRWARPGERERSAEKNRERWADPDYKARVSAAISAAHQSAEGRRVLSAAALKRWADPAIRERMLAGMVRSHQSPRHRRLMSRIRKLQWQDPELGPRYRKAARANIRKYHTRREAALPFETILTRAVDWVDARRRLRRAGYEIKQYDGVVLVNGDPCSDSRLYP